MAGNRIITSPTLWHGLLPFLDWIGPLKNRGALRADLVAGLSVALVLVPQSMAYAQIAGLPLHYGLYAAFLPTMVAALMGSSRQLATGPVALASLLSAAALEPLASGGAQDYLAYAVLLTFMVGAFQLLLGLFRLAALVGLLSNPVVTGFTNAAALIIAISQLGWLLGIGPLQVEYHRETMVPLLETVLRNTHMPTLWMGLLSIALIYGLREYLPGLLNLFVVAASTTLLSWYTGFQAAGGLVVGRLPTGLPEFALPAFDWELISRLAFMAVTIALIGFTETVSTARAMAARTRQRLDANRELVGQGLSNMVAGCFSGLPVAGARSRSAANLEAGAVTGLSSLVTGLAVGATLVWLTPLLHHLPRVTLAAIVIVAAIGLIRVEPVIHAWKAQPQDGVVAVLTFVLTLVMVPHLDQGIFIGAGLSIGLFLFRSMRPRVAVLSRFHDGTMRDIRVHHLPTSPKISVLRFDGSLYFANAGYFEAKVLEVVAANPALRYIILDGEGINQLDATGEAVLHQVAERLRAGGIQLLVARMKRQFMDSIRTTGLLELIGREHFFSRIQYALNFAWDGLGPDYDRDNCPLRNPNL